MGTSTDAWNLDFRKRGTPGTRRRSSLRELHQRRKTASRRVRKTRKSSQTRFQGPAGNLQRRPESRRRRRPEGRVFTRRKSACESIMVPGRSGEEGSGNHYEASTTNELLAP
ncbi:hypothetical protein NDU88_002471 [Pleurodeles waltl]|uniref:Uncharacterized protein n=1 Tax=Pleurodeles waltl TaxID=8319 RepID=A0AAV7NGL3_PLEWA|nr:hypothetical protein NDU88_002471 [Pleurodeles waltl]